MTGPIEKSSSEHDAILGPILALLACPGCRGDLALQGARLRCQKCSHEYEIQKGIPLLARLGSNEQWNVAIDALTSVDYQEEFQRPNIGQRYRQRYEKRWWKRRTTQREIQRIGQLLSSQSRCSRLLDIPCGGGRVSVPLAAATDLLLQADISLGQVLMARQVMALEGKIAWFTASAFTIPLKDGAVDGAVCNRLTHHLPCEAEVERLIQELVRVSTKFIILSYYDHNSLKSLSRRLRGKYPGHTLRRKDVQTLAERHGTRVQIDVPLWYRGSRLRYALLQKPGS